MSVKDDMRKNLILYLELAGKNQTELANTLGITRGAVSAWARGKANIDVEYIPTICDMLGIEIADLFGSNQDEDVKALSQAYTGLDEDDKKLVREFISFLRWRR